MNILIAEDEKDIRHLIKIGLEKEGYSVTEASDGFEALEWLEKQKFDLAIFDVIMPRLDGFNLLRKIRETHHLPVIFLTARGEEMDKILGLGLGADDYLVKPFSMGELIARVGAQLRRNREYMTQQKKEVSKISFGNISLDREACCIYKNNEPVELNAKEYLLLKHLMENPNRVYTKKQLYKHVWEEDYYYDDNTIMVHISRIRNKIEDDPKNPEYIKTIRNIGYKFQSEGRREG
ncbi:response regulator transcription factor [Sinanaerobacter chloroacetimidivorans]|uniref:Stage 0 sporulation protein A homolog n=1 Tax=Sinanaerobacter chloroacetimidivorans TaxID=2818044 RepID=A0A8J7W0R5_9FIRM|nr:response regulator transcription factor [Sinanaerobacter chloroacetimidivorans]MBR0598667.1 response regulator transcription factor [Sinanaerobacter chloroacetimidivorans]